MVIQFSLPTNYPDEVPEATVVSATGLDDVEMREVERVIAEQVNGI